MIFESSWIKSERDMGEVCPQFEKNFKTNGDIKKARLTITASGVYVAALNGDRIGNFILAPGWTSYSTRLQYQAYDIKKLLKDENELSVTVGAGWYRGRINHAKRLTERPAAIIAVIDIEYSDGRKERIFTDDTWRVRESKIRFSDIYDGEIFDATFDNSICEKTVITNEIPTDTLIPQEGEIVCEHERLKPAEFIVTPKGERVIDFGQEITGYVEFSVNARFGDMVEISCAEVLDKDGNFYNENYRSAKSKLVYICSEGEQQYKPQLTFYGFRYIRLDSFPDNVNIDAFTAIAVYSDISETGNILCSNSKLNQLFSNIKWSQRDNFLDVPTDCPQRDERLGWTGDAEVFAKTAVYNYNVKKFFKKWLRDLCADQGDNGAIPHICPYIWDDKKTTGGSAAWGDAITVIPWQIYMTYGDTEVLEETFSAMEKWISFIENDSKEQYLWVSREAIRHFGDWLALDGNGDVMSGSTSVDLIASAYYANSVNILVQAGKALKKDVAEYEKLYENIKSSFKKRFSVFKTQTDHVLALVFDLTDDPKETAISLAEMIKENGNRLTTGFVGTPNLLYALSENGQCDTAYELLCGEKYPSWLYSVNMGATTVWEHWDGIREDGTFWDVSMNSYNHYAYGAVMSWVYSVAAGIKPGEAGYKGIIIEPRPSGRLEWLEAEFISPEGKVISAWSYKDGSVQYRITVPASAKIIIDGVCRKVGKGSYIFYGKA